MKTIINTIQNSLSGKITCVISASILLAASSQIAIPLYPVPFTLQTITVLFLSFVLGKELATISVGIYLLEGTMGMPVFAHFSSGVHTLFGPTGGYLFGFMVTAYFAGILYERFRSRKIWPLFLIGLLGEVPIFFCGYIYLACFVGWRQALWTGAFPFLASTCIKNAFLALLLNKKFCHY